MPTKRRPVRRPLRRRPVRRMNPDMTPLEQARELRSMIETDIRAPYVSAYVSTLGGEHRPSVAISISLDPRETWSNGIMENSSYGNFMVHFSDHSLKQLSGWKVVKMRAGKFKDNADVIAKLRKWIASQ